MCFSYREVGSCVPKLLPSTFPGDAGLVGGFVFMGPRLLGRGSGAMRELADHRLDLGDHALRRGVLHHVADIRHTISFAFGTAFANGREWRFVDSVLSPRWTALQTQGGYRTLSEKCHGVTGPL